MSRRFCLIGLVSLPAPRELPVTRELDRINWMEFRAVVPSRVDTVLDPPGTLEPHGVTATGADVIAPVAITRAIAPRVNALIAPVVAYGITGSMEGQGSAIRSRQGQRVFRPGK